MNNTVHDNVMTYWENKVVQFLHDNNNRLGKFDHENEMLTFITDYDDIVTVSYDKLNYRMDEELLKKSGKTNPWIWTELTESIKPDRKAGESVPLGFLKEGYKEWTPCMAWIKKGYVERKS